MRSISRWPILLGACLLLAGSAGQAEPTDEEKRQLFLKAREQMHTVPSATPEKSASPRRKPKPAKHPPPKKKQSSPKSTPEPEETPEHTPAKPSPEPEETATPRSRPNESSTPGRAAEAKPAATAAESPTASAAPAQVIVQKSGYQKPRGFSLLPFHFFAKHYDYLTRSVRSQIDRAPVLRERWRFIIVHNSGTRQGNARIFDYYHRHVRRMQNGLAYHFVIGNGTSSGDGEIEVGDRWTRQINGGHVHSDYLNNISLGICLVGDFNRDQPTRAQLASCEELIRYLRARCGKVERKEIPVRPHREMNPPRWATDCPGDDFPYRWFQNF
ncbi:MAG: N-acetylmuramoyl-L-alanine amidase [Chthoniobacterales bacterium]|nr:N-acetylmuramoyl-L-alanine amidase [Chthoniobacterales bacterium]